jgi:hypothetical protein
MGVLDEAGEEFEGIRDEELPVTEHSNGRRPDSPVATVQQCFEEFRLDGASGLVAPDGLKLHTLAFVRGKLDVFKPCSEFPGDLGTPLSQELFGRLTFNTIG